MTPTVQSIQLASTRDVKTHALKEIHALTMQNVEFPSIDHCAIVHQDGAVILRDHAINVRREEILSLKFEKSFKFSFQPNVAVMTNVHTTRRVTTKSA